MARNLKKFANSKFVKTVDLTLLRRLFDRHQPYDPVLFTGTPVEVRGRLVKLFTGNESALAEGLVIDLHRVSELGTERGMTLLQARAESQAVQIVSDERCQAEVLDPKHFAMMAFLNQPGVFDAASDLMSLEAWSSLSEYVGADEGVEATLDNTTKGLFEKAAGALFRRDERSSYCRVGWYDDDGDINVVATHGAPATLKPVIDGEAENVISYRAAEQAVISYHPPTGRLKIGGVLPARRAALANMFAEIMLGREGFFAGPESQQLYTLTSMQEQGFRFRIDHAFDPEITHVQITELQVDRITTTSAGDVHVIHSMLIRDNRNNALLSLREIVSAGLTFGPNNYRIGHVVIRVQFKPPKGRPVKATVKVKPPSQAVFKRHRFEGRILELLRRNGFCHDRNATSVAAAAE